MKFRTIVIGGLAMAAWTVVASAQTGSADRLMQPDNSFMTNAAQGGMEEVELGKLAVQRASDPKVKEFGQHMVDDHTAANEKLKALAMKKGVSLPPRMSSEQQSVYAKLSKLNGAEFDSAYMQYMIDGHKATAAEFQREASMGNDADVKNFAQETLPTVQDHLRLAQDTQGQLKK